MLPQIKIMIPGVIVAMDVQVGKCFLFFVKE